MALHRPVTLALRLGPMRIDESLRIPAPCGMRTVPRGIGIAYRRPWILEYSLPSCSRHGICGGPGA